MKKDLTTEEGREAAFTKLENELRGELQRAGIRLQPRYYLVLSATSVDIGALGTKNKRMFASEITITCAGIREWDRHRSARISFGSCGSFDPTELDASYWRTYNAAILVARWKKVVPIINEYCRKYRALEDEIFSTTK